MNQTLKLSLFALLLAVLALVAVNPALAQPTTTQTTLSVAMALTDNYVTLASSTGVSAQGVNNQVITAMVVDSEYMEVVANVNSLGTGNQWTVRRMPNGFGGSVRSSHVSGAIVFLGVPGAFDNGPNDLAGTCSSSAVRPNYRTHHVSRCVGGLWQQGLLLQNVAQPFTAFTTLGVPNAIAVNSTANVAGTIWFSQIYIENNVTLTGACLLNGITIGTDKTIYALYDAAGALVASTAVAGTTTATASKYQCINFTATVAVVGPATYFIAQQGNGTTDNFATYAANSAPTNYGTNNQTGVFGTLAAITPTVTFAANKGPIMMVF